MEDENVDARIEENTMLVEANKKRKLKTPAQLQALEEYYEEHKYPTESLKSEIAEKLGLTEKQVSGWFCHRRLKDKRLSKEEAFGNCRMDRSSGVIQEHGSEPGQDSCGSTKPGGYNKHADLREVESQWLDGQAFSPKNVRCHKGMNVARLDYDMDDTSSESSSPLRPSDFPQHIVPQMWESSKYGVDTPSNSKVVIGKQLRRPSGYLKIIPKAEHPAISAVKRQLGNNFRQDGPSLGIQFDPLPVDAFQATPKVTAKGPSNAADSILYSISGHGVNSRLKMPKGLYRPDDIYLKEQSAVVNNESEVCYSNHQPRSKSYSRNNGILHHGWEPSSNINQGYADETYVTKMDVSNRAKYKLNGLQIQPISSDQVIPCAETRTTKHIDVSSHNTCYVNPKNVQRSKNLKNQLPNRKLTQREPHDTIERMPYTRELEIEMHDPVTSNTSERHNLVTSTAMSNYELTDKYPMPYRVRDVAENDLEENGAQVDCPHTQHDFTKNGSFPISYDSGPSGAGIPSSSSSSEDEDALETNSSDDE